MDCLVEDKKNINNLKLKDMIYKNLDIHKIIQNCFTSINKHLVN